MPECRITDILTVDWLKATTLLGVDLTLDDGSEYPDTIFTQALEFGIATVQNETGLTLEQFTVEEESHDLYQPNRDGWWPFTLDETPVRRITAWRARFGAFPVVEFPVSWIRWAEKLYGKFSIIPSSESLGSYSSAMAGGVQLVAGLEGTDYIPDYFEFDYEAGFVCWSDTITIPEGETTASFSFPEGYEMVDRPTIKLTLDVANGATGLRLSKRSKRAFTVSVSTAPGAGGATVSFFADSIPSDIKQAVGILAAMLPLAVAGDLIVGAGIASISTSMDGLSQSVNTTASATNSGYGARILELRKQLDALMPAIKARYKMPSMAII